MIDKERRKMNKWQPPRFGEKQADEVSCWGFGITHGMRDLPRLTKALKEINVTAVYPNMPYGTLAIFRTKNEAIVGRNEMLQSFPCGGISEVYVEEKYLNGQDAER